jgi:hypothetical protein
MKRSSNSLLLLLAVLVLATRAYPCTWSDGYFYQVSELRGYVVGAKIGAFQHIRWLRQSFARKNATLTLYEYRRPIKQRDEMPLVKTTKTDADGWFDFGEVAPGHYTLIVEEGEWGSSEWFDVEVKPKATQTMAVRIDVSPVFPDCTGGHELIVKEHLGKPLGQQLIVSAVVVFLGAVFCYVWMRRRRVRLKSPAMG